MRIIIRPLRLESHGYKGRDLSRFLDLAMEPWNMAKAKEGCELGMSIMGKGKRDIIWLIQNLASFRK